VRRFVTDRSTFGNIAQTVAILTERSYGRPVTIRDVAAAAGVATSTVSRALSHPDRVSPATRARVLKAASELRYVPSGQARALSSGRSGIVALLVPDIANPFFTGVIRATQRQLSASHYTLMLVDTEESPEVELAAIEKLCSSVDGMVLTASRLSDDQLVDLSARVKLVTINREVPGIPTTKIDTPGGVVQAMEHLASLGHRRVVYVAGPESSSSSSLRWSAIQSAGERLGVLTTTTRPVSPNLRSGAAAADTVLNGDATACIAFNDLVAIGMLGRFAERGIRVPDDISVVGCDDIFGADFCNPPLTTITAPVDQAGRAAIAMLISRFGDETARREVTTLATHLTIRRSTGPAPRGSAVSVISE
jgi:LacI family repressor for deo operon, udp, cdd, tsx, nupC, and nupG